jgi:hypothetical protein
MTHVLERHQWCTKLDDYDKQLASAHWQAYQRAVGDEGAYKTHAQFAEVWIKQQQELVADLGGFVLTFGGADDPRYPILATLSFFLFYEALYTLLSYFAEERDMSFNPRGWRIRSLLLRHDHPHPSFRRDHLIEQYIEMNRSSASKSTTTLADLNRALAWLLSFVVEGMKGVIANRRRKGYELHGMWRSKYAFWHRSASHR